MHGASAEQQAEVIQTIPDTIQENELLWIDVENPSEQELGQLQTRYGLDPYAIEDVVHGKQRPKVEEYQGNVFSVVHVPTSLQEDLRGSTKAKSGSDQLGVVEIFFFLGDHWVITLHKGEPEIIEVVEKRLRARGLSPLTNTPSPDLLFYVFLDFAVDAFYPILDRTQNQIEELESQAVVAFKSRRNRPGKIDVILTTMNGVRKRLDRLRREISPIRDVLGMIMRGSVPFISDSSLMNFRDIYDHTFQLVETIDAYRDRTSDVRDLYISLLAASTDNIIKLLTIVATVLLPLTLLAGIYGMNFTPGFFEPGSGMWYGFYVLIAGMIAIALVLTYMFRRAGWI